MEKRIDDRVAALERAALAAEGSVFAIQDVLARSLAQMPQSECRQMIADLMAHSHQLDPALGTDRIDSYREGLRAILDEVEHARRHMPAAVPQSRA